MEINQIPSNWDLIPLHDKSPARYSTGWQHKEPLPRHQLEKELETSRFNAVGVRLGEWSTGLLAIDYDGIEAETWMQLEVGPMPSTVAVTSGRDYRKQCFYHVPQKYWEHLSYKKPIKELEFRWTGTQSVVMGKHPDPNYKYRWVEGCSPDEVLVANIPDIFLAVAYPSLRERLTVKSALDAIPVAACDYDQWVKVGMALHSVALDDGLLDWITWSQEDVDRFNRETCEYKWQSFTEDKGVGVGTLIHIAKEFGWKNPFPFENEEPTNEDWDEESKRVLSELERISAMRNSWAKRWELEKLAGSIKIFGIGGDRLMKWYKDTFRPQRESGLFFGGDLKEAFDNMPEQKWLVRGMLPLGSVLVLGARGGTGKTLLAYDWAACVISGKPWSGLETIQGNVLVIQKDESKQVYLGRLHKRGIIGSSQEHRFALTSDWDFDDIAQLKEWVVKHEIVYVVIDSLKATNRKSGKLENDSDFGDCLLDVKAIAEDTNCCVLVIHHCNKANDLRGSTAIVDNSDGTMLLRKPNNDELGKVDKSQRILEFVKVRLGNFQGSHVIECEYNHTNIWTYRGPLEEGMEVSYTTHRTLAQKLIALFEMNRGRKFTIAEIKELDEFPETVQKIGEKLTEIGVQREGTRGVKYWID